MTAQNGEANDTESAKAESNDVGGVRKAVFFLDANIALHYQRLDQIKWTDITDAPKIEIVLCAIFFKELEEAKSLHDSKKIRHRAGAYIGWLLDKFEHPLITDRVSLVFLPNEPRISFKAHQLDPTIGDDRLIASVIEYCENNPNQPVDVLTADSGVIFKLKFRRIGATGFPDSYKLTEVDPVEQELKLVKAQLAQHLNRQPKLQLSFDEGRGHLSVERKPPRKDVADIVENRLSIIKKKHPLFAIIDNNAASAANTDSPVFGHIKNGPFDIRKFELSPTGMMKYENQRSEAKNQELRKFYREYEVYLLDLLAYQERLNAVIPLQLFLANQNGTAPANRIEIFVECGDELSFSDTEKIGILPKAPTPPRRSDSLIDAWNSPPPFLHNFRTMADVMRENAPDRDKLEVSRRTVKFFITHLKHKQSRSLDLIYLDFGSIDRLRNVTLEYQLHAPEIIEPVKGSLHLRVE
ncbi:MAG TPA: hypothetical protein VJ577_20275 [Burkholderiaceae bacterium]|nr:hypothetical protein [Burkholderiaceae bacterium]